MERDRGADPTTPSARPSEQQRREKDGEASRVGFDDEVNPGK
jgi:hypothetical protein